jgi:hypothetical protein
MSQGIQVSGASTCLYYPKGAYYWCATTETTPINYDDSSTYTVCDCGN